MFVASGAFAGVATSDDIVFRGYFGPPAGGSLANGNGGLETWTGIAYMPGDLAQPDGVTLASLEEGTCNGWTSASLDFLGTYGRYWEGQLDAMGNDIGFRKYSAAVEVFGANGCSESTQYLHCFMYTPKSSGGEDPHFNGFNGERLDIVHDAASTNKVFTLFCSEKVTLNALFSSTVDDRLYMTEMYVLSGDDKITIALGESPISGERMELDRGYIIYRAQKKQSVVVSENVRIVVTEAVEDEVSFLNVDMHVVPGADVPATGIIGRTLNFKLSDAEFANYKKFQTTGKFVGSKECKF